MSTLQVRNVESPDGGVADNLKPVTASAWVNFNGTGTVSIRDSYNVASITDNGAGNYTVNFENVLGNTNYSTSVTATANASISTSLTTSVTVLSRDSAGSLADSSVVSTQIFGGQ